VSQSFDLRLEVENLTECRGKVGEEKAKENGEGQQQQVL
jgi:hypothetical protein